ncbi:MAG TPA: UDP-3-O-(3-hydroxymyristoyl)glucosamine N-acyltransferase [Candidatus Margulisbacteria bacterium]|nr:UDP-3-O-(3-hydroxymyristoyl)glucosamine N-acyltransferase [Candidatus Margulisiibacteriota bacterium]
MIIFLNIEIVNANKIKKMMRNIKAREIQYLLNVNDQVIGDTDLYFNNAPVAELINDESLDWINPLKSNKLDYLLNSKAKVIICDNSIEIPDNIGKEKCLIVVENPKLTFLRIVNAFFLRKVKFGIHETANIHPEGIVSDNCFIGPYTYVGKSTIGENSIIYGHCYIYDGVTIGSNVTIHAGTVIGADGFGYQRNEKGEFEKFPHIGGVEIKDFVEIGANTCIDRGALGNTIIEEGVKIDNLVHIAHNVIIGKHTAVIAHSMVGGSTTIGDYSWVAPSVALRDQIKIGNNTIVGMGAVVTKNIPDDQSWTGSPAKELSEFLAIQKKIKNL